MSVAPDDTKSADRLSGADQMSFAGNTTYKSFNLTVSADVTTSLWVKSAGAATTAAVGLRDGVNGTIGFTDYPITTEWQRITHTKSLSASSSTRMMIGNIDGSVYIWGAQCEVQPFASSYIRTEGAVVSRSADSLNLPVTSIPAPSKKQSVIVNFSAQLQAINDRVYEIGGTGNGRRHMFLTSTNIGYRYQNTVNFTAPLVGNTPYNTVSSFDGTSVKFYVDENLIFSSTVADQTDTSTTFKIGADINGSSPFYGHISKFKTYAQALTAQEITLL